MEETTKAPAEHYDKVPDPLDGCHWCACGNRWPCKDAGKAPAERGSCTGCKIEYQLSVARNGEFKGEKVVRKHLSRVAQGECSGSRKPPRVDHTEGCTEEARLGPSVCAGCPQPEPTPEQCNVEFVGGGRCTKAAGHRTLVNQDPHTPPKTAEEAMPSVGAGCPQPEPTPEQCAEMDRRMADPGGVPVFADPTPVTEAVQAIAERIPELFADPTPVPSAFVALAAPEVAGVGTVADQFADPSPMPAELPAVHGQPEPDRDRWGRYKIFGESHTRATTFAKAASSTHALSEWRERMVVLGLAQRRDLLAMAHGLHVKQDRKTLNDIASQAKDAAGVKVAANLGTAYHAFSERLDAGLMKLAEVPEEYRARMQEYVATIHAHGLVTRPDWIERTTAVRADQVSAQVPVAGTLDRIFQLPNGELVIGDLKTGADLSYGWGEIAVQLALYAHGVNTHGLFDWNTKSWQGVGSDHDETLRVRTDYGIVIHLPADGQGCTVYRIDLAKGWERAQVCGQVMSMQKEKDGLAIPLTAPLNAAPAEPHPATLPDSPRGLGGFAGNGTAVLQAAAETLAAPAESDWDRALRLFRGVASKAEAAQLYDFASTSGKFHQHQLSTLIGEARTTLQRQGIAVLPFSPDQETGPGFLLVSVSTLCL